MVKKDYGWNDLYYSFGYGCIAILLVIEMITPKFGGSETVLLQKTAVKIADIVKTA